MLGAEDPLVSRGGFQFERWDFFFCSSFFSGFNGLDLIANGRIEGDAGSQCAYTATDETHTHESDRG